MSAEKSFNLYKEYSMSQSYSLMLSHEANKHMYMKRTMDLVLSLIGAILAIPVIAIFSILISIESPGSPFYLQERVGKNGKYFKVMKLRSMRLDAETGSGAQWAQKNDPRVTAIGAFIRKTRIDELPQLFNVLRGEMSIIGPRPERPIFTAQFNEEIPGFTDRLIVKPGLTGWAQVNGGYEISPKEKLALDIYYINNMSLKLDVMILFKTVRVILTGEGAR
ncbi:exopolysaccharide biosynthesis polyprenyl glycosylphosphotransferase [Bacillus mangrovi]|uniref:Exopolysaccharide biosynthesis polyprenyl glycosylphosphotransferase n=1 Tax=Metabacillus mangrovi TaxID=1491830 RepID=A0A7X2V6A4_9BACI|nr:sugar transferase [Metabacillus mangrovi]MTH55036.1 exopolysaccharide biosynthesis polyprenyl glycosylphosphotransferase [Metabacillus mangrovi]